MGIIRSRWETIREKFILKRLLTISDNGEGDDHPTPVFPISVRPAYALSEREKENVNGLMRYLRKYILL
ncbi:hypothetical protein [Paraflavitalea speifideaquila]|uniref:hypothetical protein n=1 Tax=Paraflavitalea speifideaquila TaxID=3076558 RepID=UPI0028E922D7|nr:hypothetical protein [Paraflavitalea speifideiaquila]